MTDYINSQLLALYDSINNITHYTLYIPASFLSFRFCVAVMKEFISSINLITQYVRDHSLLSLISYYNGFHFIFKSKGKFIPPGQEVAIHNVRKNIIDF